jgi:FMN-dependent NADH-azoreductase
MTLLHIDSSILGDASASRKITRATVDALTAKHPGTQVTYRDLSQLTNHVTGLTLAAGGTPVEQQNEALKAEAALSSSLINEFLAAETIVIGVPMYNFSISSQLKSWIDRISVAGVTFKYTEKGPEGLAGGKKVILVSTAGGQHAGQPSGYAHEDYVRFVLGFLGITDIKTVRAETLAYGPEAHAAAIDGALKQISQVI